MLKSNSVYFNQSKAPSLSGAVVLYQDLPEKTNYKASIAVSSLVLFASVSILQLNYVHSEEVGEGPATAPATYAEDATATPTPTPSNNNGGGSNGGGGNNGGGGGSNGPAVCNDAKPGSAPVITNAVVSGPNQVTLTWSKAHDPVTYYLATYGLKPGSQQYGNPNIGDKNATSAKINGLSAGVTYYFKIRAGNNCIPGDFSNEAGIRVVKGAKFTGPAQGFTAGILGSKKVTQNVVINKNTKSQTVPVKKINQVNNGPKNSFFSVVQNFLNNLFN